MPATLPCDVSPYEVGVIISHLMEAQPGRPTAFASGSCVFEKENNIWLERETLCLVWGVRELHCCLSKNCLYLQIIQEQCGQ